MFSFESIGRLHPLIVHLPIGILLFAFALVLYQRFRRADIDDIIAFALLLGSISAVAACVVGWILEQSGEYDADLVFKHQWTGIATAGLGFSAYFVKRIRDILTTITAGILVVAGHYGGNLTHGEDYLFPKKKTPSVKTAQTADTTQNIRNQQIKALSGTSKNTIKATSNALVQPTIQKSFFYRDLVIPILENKCYGCHSATKKKGGLRLDTEEFIKEGGKNGSVLTAGNPENSPLFSSLLLPEDDDKHMPPKGKPQLTPQDIATIHFWIKKGASFQEVVENVQRGSANATTNLTANLVVPKLAKTLVTDSTKMAVALPKTVANAPVQNMEATILKNKIEPATPSVLSQLRQQNISISNFGEGSNYLMANFVNVKNYNSALIDNLKNIDKQLVRLKLSDQPVSDADVKKLSSLKNLTRLNLEKTAITDVALGYLKDLPNLEQVNLYGTGITDKGLSALANCPNLKVIYLWQTKTTAVGIAQLKKALPNVEVDTGGFQFTKPDTNKIKSDKINGL